MRIVSVFLCLSFTILAAAELAAEEASAGSRASFTRGGWVGSRYLATGMTGEVLADDVYSIYWNPSGLTELRGREGLTAEEIKTKATQGRVDQINENDLLNISDADEDRTFVQVGISGTKLDFDREAAFFGVAFSLPEDAFGFGIYTIFSDEIDSYDLNGYYRGDLYYIGTSGLFSYARQMGIVSLGFSAKCLYEKIGHTQYIGAGLDIGTQIYALPFIKIGFVIQDIGVGLYPIESYYGIRKKYDFGFPTLRLGIAFVSKSFSLAFSGIKNLEQDIFNWGLGVEYRPWRFVTFYLGLRDLLFSAGLSLHVIVVDMSYAFTFDAIDDGYNHMVSVKLTF